MDDAYLARSHWVVSTSDLRRVEDCRMAHVGGRAMQVDHASFTKVCERIKASGEVMAEFPRSGLIAYRLAPAS